MSSIFHRPVPKGFEPGPAPPGVENVLHAPREVVEPETASRSRSDPGQESGDSGCSLAHARAGFGPGKSLDDLKNAAGSKMSWLWHGYLAGGNLTLLTSQWKAGKTTLVAVLLGRMKTGGELAGLPLNSGNAIVVSEESPMHWVEHSKKLDLAGHVRWYCRPFVGKPKLSEWESLLEHLARLHAEAPIDLVVIDPLAAFLPGSDENSAKGMLDFLMPLGRLADRGPAVLVLHHPRKGRSPAGQSARGSGALGAYVDILIEMQWYRRGSETDRRRRLAGFSRYEQTPRQLVIELDEKGIGYTSLGDFCGEELSGSWQILRGVLEDASCTLTRHQILARWPADFQAPTEQTLWRWLDRAVGDRRLFRTGTGRRGDPHRYRLATEPDKPDGAQTPPELLGLDFL